MFRIETKKSPPKIPTKQRLKNIALYYLERFESSEDNLRAVLKRRIDKYVMYNKDYCPEQAYQWIDDIVIECKKQNFVNDERFAEFKVNGYLRAGKSRRYIEQKLKQKGIVDKIISDIFEDCNYSEYDTALNFAKKKKIACYRKDEKQREANRQKDLAALIRAGFSFDVVKEILDMNIAENDIM